MSGRGSLDCYTWGPPLLYVDAQRVQNWNCFPVQFAEHLPVVAGKAGTFGMSGNSWIVCCSGLGKESKVHPNTRPGQSRPKRMFLPTTSLGKTIYSPGTFRVAANIAVW